MLAARVKRPPKPFNCKRRDGCLPKPPMTSAISLPLPDETALDARSKSLRRMIVRTLAAGRRGHLGAAFSAVEIIRVLYDDVLRIDAGNPQWPQRDRFILSKGHGCLALYVVLADKGFFAEEELGRFCA